MPVIFIFGLPTEMTDDEVDTLSHDLKELICRITELKLSMRQITCFFPQDMSYIYEGNDIVAMVYGLFNKPERTEAVRQNLAQTICQFLKQRFEDSQIECFVELFDPQKGFSLMPK